MKSGNLNLKRSKSTLTICAVLSVGLPAFAWDAKAAWIIENRAAPGFGELAATPGVEVVTADFDGNGSTDVALVRKTPGWQSVPVALSPPFHAGAFVFQNRPAQKFALLAATPGVQVVAGDFNGDKRRDLALIKRTPGWTTVPVAFSTAGGFTFENRAATTLPGLATMPGVQLLTGDFDGNGSTDIALVRKAPGWQSVPVYFWTAGGFIVQSRPAADFAGFAATPGVEVVTGDFNGDKRTDVGLVRRTAGWTTVPVALSTASGFIVQNRSASAFASLAATPFTQLLTGDFDGDKQTDLALVRRTAGWASVPVALSRSFFGFGFGSFVLQNRPAADFAAWATAPGVQVLAGHFSLDNRTDIALVRQTPGWSTVPVAASTATGFVVASQNLGSFAAWAATPGVKVVTGDFDANAFTDLGLVRLTPGWASIPLAKTSATALRRALAVPPAGL